MLLQVHHQFKDHTEFVEQRDCAGHDEVREWAKELWISNPPPEGAQFMICNEKSEDFIKTTGGNDECKQRNSN